MDDSRTFRRAANRPYKGDPSSVSYGGESSLGLPADPIGPIPAEIPHERRQGSGTSDGAGATCSRRALPPARPAEAPAAAPPPPPPRPPPSWLRARPFRYRGRSRGGGAARWRRRPLPGGGRQVRGNGDGVGRREIPASRPFAGRLLPPGGARLRGGKEEPGRVCRQVVGGLV